MFYNYYFTFYMFFYILNINKYTKTGIYWRIFFAATGPNVVLLTTHRKTCSTGRQ